MAPLRLICMYGSKIGNIVHFAVRVLQLKCRVPTPRLSARIIWEGGRDGIFYSF